MSNENAMSQRGTIVAGETELDPLVEDMNIYLVPGRETDPNKAFTEAADAERLGFRRGFISERYDTKEAGAIASGVAARTTRLEIATGLIAAGSRHPMLMAALGTTMQAISQERFILGLGRGERDWLAHLSMQAPSYEAYVDYVDILRRLWRGETVSYEGPAGKYDALQMNDLPDCQPPPVWTGILAGPKASKVAAQVSDGVVIMDFFTPEATHNVVTWIRQERERLDLDPAIPICVCVVCAAELDETRTTNVSKARFVTYVVGLPQIAGGLAKYNGWDEKVMQRIASHPLFRDMDRSCADQAFHRDQLYEVADLVPDSWMRDSCALGSLSDCVKTLQSFRDAGADEIAVYGTTPAENAALIGAWREHTNATARVPSRSGS